MKFFNQKTLDGHTLFSVLIEDNELRANEANSSILNKFITYTLSRLGNMIAAYYFKHHKDELVAFINSDEVKEAIKQKLMDSIEIKIK